MHYLYMFLSEAEEILYIGITETMARRMTQEHFTKNGHLPKECYLGTQMILYAPCLNKDDAKVKERYFINKYAPKYNQIHNNKSSFSFTLPEPDWKYMPVDKNKLGEKQRSFIARVALLPPNQEAYLTTRYFKTISGSIPFLSKLSIDPEVFFYWPQNWKCDSLPFHVLQINGQVYFSIDQIATHCGSRIPQGSVHKCLLLIKDGLIESKDILLVGDPVFAKKIFYSHYGICGDQLLYGRQAALVTPAAAVRYLVHVAHEPYRECQKKIDKQGAFYFHDLDKQRFTNTEEFIDASIFHQTPILEHCLKPVAAALAVLGPYIESIELESRALSWVLREYKKEFQDLLAQKET